MAARRRGRAKPAQVGNMAPLRPEPETTSDILRDVVERRSMQERHLSGLLHQAVASLEQRHGKRAAELVPIGTAMDRPTLDNWLEIGQRMLAAKIGTV